MHPPCLRYWKKYLIKNSEALAYYFWSIGVFVDCRYHIDTLIDDDDDIALGNDFVLSHNLLHLVKAEESFLIHKFSSFFT